MGLCGDAWSPAARQLPLVLQHPCMVIVHTCMYLVAELCQLVLPLCPAVAKVFAGVPNVNQDEETSGISQLWYMDLENLNEP